MKTYTEEEIKNFINILIAKEDERLAAFCKRNSGSPVSCADRRASRRVYLSALFALEELMKNS